MYYECVKKYVFFEYKRDGMVLFMFIIIYIIPKLVTTEENTVYFLYLLGTTWYLWRYVTYAYTRSIYIDNILRYKLDLLIARNS